MQVLVERRYIFKRRPMKGRLILAVLASAACLGAMSLEAAIAEPGGYLRPGTIEQRVD